MNIDDIMDMLDWNNPPDVQEKGRMLARKIRCINVFLQPGHLGHCKNVWDNCAQILSERSDLELRPYFCELLEWLIDMNWPGAECIFQRLIQFQDTNWFEHNINECKHEAGVLGEEIWLSNLCKLQEVRKRLGTV